MDEAVRYFSKGLSLLGTNDDEIRADLLHRRGSAQLSLGHKEEFQADLHEAWVTIQSTEGRQESGECHS